MASLVDWIIFFIAVIIVAFFLYVATRLVTKEEVVTSSYAARLFITSLVSLVLIHVLGGAVFGLGIIIAFLVLVLMIKVLILPEASIGEEWVEAIVIALITIILAWIFIAFLGFFGLRFDLFPGLFH